jgi:hypothetical protein
MALKEEHKLRVFENRVLRRIFGVTGGWRKLHNEELHNLYSSPSIIRIIMSRRNVYRLLAGKTRVKRPIGRRRRRWVINIKMGLVERDWGGVDRICLAQDIYSWKALANVEMNLGFYKMLGNHRVVARLVGSRISLSSTELVSRRNGSFSVRFLT